MKYKLICTDMDGTLLNSVKEISKENLDAIKKAHDKGVKIAICTGRIFTSAKYYGELIGVKAPIIASNGAYIREKDREEVIYKCILEKKDCFELLEIFKKHDLVPHFYTADSIYAGETSYALRFYSRSNKTLPNGFQIKIKEVEDWNEIFNVNELDILKAVAFDDDIEKIKRAKQEIKSLGKYEVVSSLVNNFEVMNKNVSKGRAVEMLASYYNLSKDEIITIGDNENDLSMIEYAGLGVAMKNGEEIVKNKAKYITSTNDEDGVKEVIEKFILNENI